MQIARISKLGDFQMLPGHVYGQSQLRPDPIMSFPGDVFGYAPPLPSAPGAVLPTQAPAWLFPTQEQPQQPAPQPEQKSSGMTTALIVGGVVLAGIVVIAVATR